MNGTIANEAKPRTRIPDAISADVLFDSDHTCCVCREQGKSVQIHHIDGDATNHNIKNLSVLCLQCHDRTQIVGGFGRLLSPQLVVRYRDDWISRVRDRRQIADNAAAERMSRLVPKAAPSDSKPARSRIPLISFVNALPGWLSDAYARAKPQWGSGSTAEMVAASYEYLDFLVATLVGLAAYYPDGNFDRQDPSYYFSAMLASRFHWHSLHIEPDGPGSKGTIAGLSRLGHVMRDMETAVEDVVISLTENITEFSIPEWKKLWRASKGKSDPEKGG